MAEINEFPTETSDELQTDFLADVIDGLSAVHKQLDPKYFYDEVGSHLFEQITSLPEYYITRTETGIMRDVAGDIEHYCRDIRTVVEFGSGSGERSQILIGALSKLETYVPIDVSAELLEHTADAAKCANPGVTVVPVVGDFTKELYVPPMLPTEWLGYFPGSTIGNFLPTVAARFLARARRLLGRNARLLIGVDLVKPVERLEQAYDDAQGVTDAFNRNVLVRINRELGGTFELDQFAHRAVFNENLSRIEMHLVSRVDQKVEIGSEAEFTFHEGETIHTENSHKYTLGGFTDLARQAGWQCTACWTDHDNDFSVHLLNADNGGEH
jgi:L-histidine N-alpha-methyltransferase